MRRDQARTPPNPHSAMMAKAAHSSSRVGTGGEEIGGGGAEAAEIVSDMAKS
jgi:hypothetical protein